MHLITTKIKFRYIKRKLKDSDQNIDILFDKIKLMIKKYNDLKSENLEMKNKKFDTALVFLKCRALL